MKHDILYLLLFLSLYSCIEKKKNSNLNKLKEVNIINNSGVNILSGEIKNDSLPSGLWIFYNSGGKPILELNLDYSSKSKDFSIKQYDSKEKIMYEASYSDGNLLEEKSCSDFQEVSYNNGRYLYNNYLDSYYYNEFGKIKNNSLNFNSLKININLLRNKYKNIPVFNENEIKAILCFLNPKGKQIRS